MVENIFGIFNVIDLPRYVCYLLKSSTHCLAYIPNSENSVYQRKSIWLVILSILIIEFSGTGKASESATGAVPLLLTPTPRITQMLEGRFVISPNVGIYLADRRSKEDKFSAGQLAGEIQEAIATRPALRRILGGKCIVIERMGHSAAADRRLRRLGPAVPDSLGDEGYVLEVTPGRIFVAARSSAGIFYGIQTLRQLVRANREEKTIPCLTIVDWPGLRYRGWMMDVSRGPIPTLSFLKEVVTRMAEYKQNCFTLYTEHVFRLQSHPEIAPPDGITPGEITELSAFAKKYHVELIGNAQSFGHMENILASPFYANLRENKWVATPANEQTYGFLKEMYAEIVPSYDSKLFHINCDEVTGLGSGPAKAMVDSMGTDGVYAYHINRVNSILAPYGKRIMMWGDIAAANPQIINRLPKDLIIISWGYDAAENFENAILPFKKTGFDLMIAPGVSCWGQVWPQMSNAVVNISNYVRDGARLGAMGMLNTAWDDDGENLFNYNWHGLLWGAECSWNPAKPLTGEEARRDREIRVQDFNRAFDGLFVGLPGVSDALFEFDSLRALPVRNLVTDREMWSSMFEFYPEDVSDSSFIINERVVQKSRALLNRLTVLKQAARWNRPMLEAACFAAERVAFTGSKNLVRIGLARAIWSPKTEEVTRVKMGLRNLLQDLHRLKAEYVGLWQSENRGWWLDRIMGKYDHLGNQLLNLERVVLIEPESNVTGGERLVALNTPFADQQIYYSVDGSEPSLRSSHYTAPVPIDRSSLIRARVFANGNGFELSEQFVMVHKAIGKLLRLNSRYSQYSPAYAAGGPMGLLDGLRGSENFADGRWQGYQGEDLDIIIDLQKPTEVKRISIGLLQQSYSWILMPERVQFWTSADGQNFTLTREVVNTVDPRQEGTMIRDVAAEFDHLTARFLKVVAKNPGKLPAWHHAAGNDSFIFADEIIVE